MLKQARYWLIIPAAGSGTRMNQAIPKQYLQINNKTILEHTLNCFVGREEIETIIVVLAKNDTYWHTLALASHPKITLATGGPERFQSVLHGLYALHGKARPDDWVLVHDAARPCLSQSDLDRLIHMASDHTVGGLLATPVRDTIKRGSHQVIETINRTHLWHAVTPQMFRLQALQDAILSAIQHHTHITDEAMAMELKGHRPLLVEGTPNNIKVTTPMDLSLAEAFFTIQEDRS